MCYFYSFMVHSFFLNKAKVHYPAYISRFIAYITIYMYIYVRYTLYLYDAYTTMHVVYIWATFVQKMQLLIVFSMYMLRTERSLKLCILGALMKVLTSIRGLQ